MQVEIEIRWASKKRASTFSLQRDFTCLQKSLQAVKRHCRGKGGSREDFVMQFSHTSMINGVQTVCGTGVSL